MSTMMRILAATALLIALMAVPTRVLGQQAEASPEGTRFCEADTRSEIAAYCTALAAFQSAVNSAKAAEAKGGPTPTKDNFKNMLNRLDVSQADAAANFIRAAAGGYATTLATSTAMTSKAAASTASIDAGPGRPDQQLGSNNNASGTTSLVSKGGSAELLSLALDTGALTQSANGTTTTLSTNADQVFRLVTGKDPDCTVTCKSLGWFENKVLSPTNISASFVLAQESSTTVATTGQASGTTPTPVSSAAIPTGIGKLSSITARYQVRNRFDPRSTQFKTAWNNEVAGNVTLDAALANLGTATENVKNILMASEPALDRDKILAAAESDTTGKALVDFFEAYFKNALATGKSNNKLGVAILQVNPFRAAYRDAWIQALDDAVGNLFTVEYSYNRPLNQPETHDIKLIYAYNFRTMGMLTFNGAASIYGGSIPAGAQYGRIHDGQISGEYDRTLSGKNKSIQSQLSLAGYWQYQPNPSVLNIPAGTVVPGTAIPLPNGTQEFVGTAGSLWVTQAKITIKGSGGINIPIAVSWSNKTDLLQGNKVGAQIGISYNFSSLAGLFSGGGGQ